MKGVLHSHAAKAADKRQRLKRQEALKKAVVDLVRLELLPACHESPLRSIVQKLLQAAAAGKQKQTRSTCHLDHAGHLGVCPSSSSLQQLRGQLLPQRMCHSAAAQWLQMCPCPACR